MPAELLGVAVNVFDEFEQVAIGREDKHAIRAEHLLVRLHRLNECVEGDGVGALIVSFSIDLGCLGIGLTADLLDGLVGFRLNLQ